MDLEVPEGFEKIDATVYRKEGQLLVVGVLDPEGPFAVGLTLGPSTEELGPPPDGYEWTGEIRPPRKGELFWSELHGRIVEAVKDETGFNQFGEPTGGRKILRPRSAPPEEPKPKRAHLRLVKTGEDE